MQTLEDRELPKGSSPVIQFKNGPTKVEEREKETSEFSCCSCYSRKNRKTLNECSSDSSKSRIPNKSLASQVNHSKPSSQDKRSKNPGSKSLNSDRSNEKKPLITRRKPELNLILPQISMPGDDFDIEPEPHRIRKNSAEGTFLVDREYYNRQSRSSNYLSSDFNSIQSPGLLRAHSPHSISSKSALSSLTMTIYGDIGFGLIRRRENRSVPTHPRSILKCRSPDSRSSRTDRCSEASHTFTQTIDSLKVNKRVSFHNKNQIKFIDRVDITQRSRVVKLLKTKRELSQQMIDVEEALRKEFNDRND